MLNYLFVETAGVYLPVKDIDQVLLPEVELRACCTTELDTDPEDTWLYKMLG